MFDFGKITEALSGVLGSQAAQALQPDDLLQQLQEAGLNIESLQGLSPPEILDLIQQHGIDPSQFNFAELSGVLENLGVNPQLTDLASSFFDRQGGGER